MDPKTSKSDRSSKLLVQAEAFFGALVGLLIVSIAYHLVFSKRIIPGVEVAGVYVGGLKYDDAVNLLHSKEVESRNIYFAYDGFSYDFNPANINFSYDWNQSAKNAFEIGRSGDFWIDTEQKIIGLLKSWEIPAAYEYNEDLLTLEMDSIRQSINKEPHDAYFVLEEGAVKVAAPEDGKRIPYKELYELLMNCFGQMDFGEKPLPVSEVKSEVSEQDLLGIQSEIQDIVFNPIKLVFEDQIWEFTPEQRLDYVLVLKRNDEVVITLDRNSFASFIDKLRLDVNELPRGNVTVLDGKKVVGFEVTKSGRELDMEKFEDEFEKAFLAKKEQMIVPVKEITGPDTSEKYGITALLGEGSSRFTGSQKERVHNLTLAAGRTDGVLVPPGGIYSFNEAVGEISSRVGYDTAYIISQGRTILGEGGGVCQTSTTLFRAILDSGLPVVKRYPHAYRVYYYELDRPVGFDASIYQPSLDLQFKNDTVNYVLVQATWDFYAQTLTFSLYGTPDGRTVEISDPIVTNLTPPPEALYQDDPTLPKGTVKQVDFAAWGANSVFTRTVKKGEEILYEETYKSSYQPWRAVYLVGTKD